MLYKYVCVLWRLSIRSDLIFGLSLCGDEDFLSCVCKFPLFRDVFDLFSLQIFRASLTLDFTKPLCFLLVHSFVQSISLKQQSNLQHQPRQNEASSTRVRQRRIQQRLHQQRYFHGIMLLNIIGKEQSKHSTDYKLLPHKTKTTQLLAYGLNELTTANIENPVADKSKSKDVSLTKVEVTTTHPN